MTTISAYIAKRVAIASIGSTLVIVALVWISQAVTRIDFATSSGGSITSFLHFMGLLIPQFIASVLPFGMVMGAVQVLNTMNADSEMPVLSGAGLSRLQLAKPIMAVASIAGLYALFSSHFIEPYTNASSRETLTQARADLLTTLIEPGRFTNIDDDLVVFVDEKNGATLNRIMISDTRDANLSLTYYAKVGAVAEVDGESLLVLSDGEFQRKTRGDTNVTAISFQSYALSLSQFSKSGGTTTYFVRERSTPYLMNPDADDKFFQTKPGEYKAEIHRRMTDWLYPVLMGLVGLVIAGQPRSHRFAGVSAYVLAMGTGLLYRGGGQFAFNLNKTSDSFIWLLYAIPLIGIAISIWMYATGRSVAVPDRVVTAFDRMKARFARYRIRKIRAVAS